MTRRENHLVAVPATGRTVTQAGATDAKTTQVQRHPSETSGDMNDYDTYDDDPFWSSLLTERPDADGAVTTDTAAATESRFADLSWLTLDKAEWPKTPTPSYLTRTDGACLFYAGKVNLLYGDPETAKTLLSSWGLVEALRDGKRCAIIDADHNGAAELAQNLILLGADPAVLADQDRFRIAEPEDGGSLLVMVGQLRDWGVDYVICDSLGELIPLLGLKSNDNDDVTAGIRRCLFPLSTAGACVIAIDHLPKGQAGMSRNTEFSIGGVAKKRATNGTMVLAEVVDQPAPGRVGRVKLTVMKDRPGGVRAVCEDGKRVGTFVLDSTDPRQSHARVEAPQPSRDQSGNFRPTHLMEKVSEFLASATEPMSKTGICAAVTGKNEGVRAAVDQLVREGYLTVTEGTRGPVFASAKPFKNSTWSGAGDSPF